MAMNPQSVLSQLRMMSDQQLQQYAAMHKNDPFIFPLAFQESQTRKQVRSEQQAMQPPQPKVADQALASMMPENVGIGQLPAKNLEGMCGGGIVAFDEGGEVPRFQVGGVPPSAGTQFAIPGMVTGTPILPQAGYTSPDDMTTWEKIQAYRKARQTEREDYKRKQGAPAPAAYTPSTVDPFAYDQSAFPMPAAPAATPPSAPAAAPAADTGAQLRPGGRQGLGFVPGEGLGLGTRPSTYSAELEAMQPQGEVKSPFESQIRAAGLAETKAAQEYKDLREQQMKDAGIAGLEQEKRLKGREEKLAKTEGDLSGMALLKAGMAIMSGSSPFALQNIGSGAQVGIEEYVKGRDKIDAARERLDDAFDRLEQVRRGELIMNQKEQAQLQRDVNKTIAQTEKDVLSGAREAYGWKKEDARAAFNAYVADRRTGAELTSRERLGIAQIQAHRDIAASQPDRVLWESLLRANNNDPTAAYQALTKLKTEKFNPYQSYADYLKAFAGKENVLTPPMGFTQYASQFAVPTYGSDALPGNASTRPPIK